MLGNGIINACNTIVNGLAVIVVVSVTRTPYSIQCILTHWSTSIDSPAIFFAVKMRCSLKTTFI